MDYEEALGLQHSLVAARASREIEEDLLLVLEHPEVFTLGRRGGREFLRVEDSWLSSSGMSIIQTERGGYITYHGPGQLVGYPIVDLWARGWAVPSFVEMLEEAMIMVSDEFGVKAERSSKNRGVWVGGAKLGSVGIAIRRGVSFHGLALNVNNRLEPFGWIEPCGLQGVTMTSLKELLRVDLPMVEVRRSALRHLEGLFGVSLKRANLGRVMGGLNAEEGRVGEKKR